jgi:chromate transporter
LLRVWAAISFKSFGGGQAVQLLAFDALVSSRRWLTPTSWSETYGLVQIVPGINLFALSLITGLRLAGWAGAASSVAGLVAPSFLVTVAMTALYSRVVDVRIVQAGVRGMVTAAAAMSIISAWRLFYPAFRASASENPLTAGATVAITLSAGVLVVVADVAVFALVLIAGGLMAAVLWVKRGSVRNGPS